MYHSLSSSSSLSLSLSRLVYVKCVPQSKLEPPKKNRKPNCLNTLDQHKSSSSLVCYCHFLILSSIHQMTFLLHCLLANNFIWLSFFSVPFPLTINHFHLLIFEQKFESKKLGSVRNYQTKILIFFLQKDNNLKNLNFILKFIEIFPSKIPNSTSSSLLLKRKVSLMKIQSRINLVWFVCLPIWNNNFSPSKKFIFFSLSLFLYVEDTGCILHING